MRARTGVVALIAVAGVLAGPPTLAHDAAGDEETVTPVQVRSLADVPGKQIIVATVDYRPGQSSAPHRHAGSVIAYVLEGEVISQLEGEDPVTYKVGQSWYEPPRKPHLVSRNASSTRPARLLAILLTDEGGAVKEPLPARR